MGDNSTVNRMTIATDTRSTEVLYSVDDAVMTIHGFTASFIPDNRNVLRKAILIMEEKAREELLEGINIELQISPDENEAATRFLMERGYSIPEVDSYIMEIDVDTIDKTYVLGLKDTRNTIDPTRRMKKTCSMIKDMPKLKGEVVDEFSYTLVSEKNPNKAGISVLSTEEADKLIAEYIVIEDDNIRELIPYMQVVLPGIAASDKYKKYQVMATSSIQANLIKKMLAGASFSEKIVVGSYKLL